MSLDNNPIQKIDDNDNDELLICLNTRINAHHYQISVPKIAKRTPQLHEPLAIIHCVLEHDRALKVVCFEQQSICDQLVLAINFDCHFRCRSSDALDSSERHASVSARRNEPFHVESVFAISEDGM